jgi:hypothetical protein
MLQQAYGEDCLSRTQCYEWYQSFKSGRRSIEDDPKSGRPSSSTGDDHIEKLRSVIRENRRLTVREVSAEVGIQDAFQNCKKRWVRCINSRGEYFEGDKSV